MKRFVIGRFVALAAVLLDDHRTKFESMRTLERTLDWLSERAPVCVDSKAGLEASLAVLSALPSKAGFAELAEKFNVEQPEFEKLADLDSSIDVVRAWQKNTRDDPVVHRGVVVNGIGRFLESIANSESPADLELVRTGAESLLRHVEVARKGSMMRFRAPISVADAQVERCDLAIFMARHARRTHDVRFLNAALKLNDWAVRAMSRRDDARVLARIAVALSEQEAAAFEMLSS